MKAHYARSLDGTRIAYDVSGSGPTIVLLHGGGQSRGDWHEAGYIDRLTDAYQVIAMDIRGNGGSDKPVDRSAYTSDRLGEDILAVADACGVQHFVLWGFSYGGNIGRYLAERADRVSGMVIIGIPFGPGVSGAFRANIERMVEHWTPIVQSQRAGTLDEGTLSAEDRQFLAARNMPLDLAWTGAMLDWRSITPQDIRVPTLWLMGSENVDAMASLKEYENKLGPCVRAHVVAGFTHLQEFTQIDVVLPLMRVFTDSVQPSA